MYNFTHTYQLTLNAKLLALFLGRSAEGVWPRPLPCFRRDHESCNKYDSAVTGQIPKPVLKDVRRGWFTRGAIYPKLPGPCFPTCYECTNFTRQIFQKIFYAYVEWNARTMRLMESTRQVSQSRGSQAPCGCTLISVPKARTQVLVVASMGLEKPHPTVAFHASFSMFNSYDLWYHLIMFSCHTRFSTSDTSSGWTSTDSYAWQSRTQILALAVHTSQT